MKLELFIKYLGLILVVLWATTVAWAKENNDIKAPSYIQPKASTDSAVNNGKYLPEIKIESAAIQSTLKKSTGSYAVLSRDRLESKSSAWWSEPLNNLPGVFMQQGALNTSRITIRGVGSRSPYSTTRIKTYWNDIPITSLEGSTSLEGFSLNQIDKIEVNKGPAAVNFGAGLGGTINMYTNHQKNSISFDSELGNFGNFNNNFAANLGDSISKVNVRYGTLNSNGYRQHSDFERKNITISAYHSINKHQFSLHLHTSSVDAQIPSSLSNTQMTQDRWMAAPNWEAIKGYESSYATIAGFSWNYELNKTISNKATLFFKNGSGFERRPFNTLDDNSESYGVRNTTSYKIKKWHIVFSTELQREKYNWSLYESSLENNGDLFYSNSDTKSNINLGLLTAYKLSSKLALEAGVSFNWQHYNLAKATDNKNSYWFKPITTPSLGLNYTVNSQHNIYASVNTGFSYPSLEETLLPEGNFNKNLEPEQGSVFNTGWRYSAFGKRWYNDLGFYFMDLDNLLVTKRETEEIFYQINAGETHHWGAEVTGEAKITHPNSLFYTSLSYSMWGSINRFKTFIDDGISYADKNLPGIPSFTGNANINIASPGNTYLILGYIITGQQYLDDANSAETENYNLFNLRIGYNYNNSHIQGKIFLGANNVFNKDYIAMIVPNAVGFGGRQPRYFYPGIPRYIYGGIKIHLLK